MEVGSAGSGADGWLKVGISSNEPRLRASLSCCCCCCCDCCCCCKDDDATMGMDDDEGMEMAAEELGG